VTENFQERVAKWMLACFGPEIAGDRIERNHRFIEEALELVQANGCTESEAHQLVDYTFGRPKGEPRQEVGSVMVTLAALCLACNMDMGREAETELARVWTKVEQIRAKQAAKPCMPRRLQGLIWVAACISGSRRSIASPGPGAATLPSLGPGTPGVGAGDVRTARAPRRLRGGAAALVERLPMKLTCLLTFGEYAAMGDDAVARGFYRDDPRIFTPGMGWFCPWVFDPSGEREAAGKHVMIRRADKGRLGYLSVHYWRDWADKRPPLCVVCPNGESWEIDRKSSNGDGWMVTGEWPNLTCSPSIVVDGYHGFLRDGGFTPDLEGRGPHGTSRPIVDRPSP
jgi:hypothetical protein